MMMRLDGRFLVVVPNLVPNDEGIPPGEAGISTDRFVSRGVALSRSRRNLDRAIGGPGQHDRTPRSAWRTRQVSARTRPRPALRARSTAGRGDRLGRLPDDSTVGRI